MNYAMDQCFDVLPIHMKKMTKLENDTRIGFDLEK